ncbi:hypothetical protein F2Q69_00060667 [Brassica cretica]|uniref:Uncharacterized protein n=1 Tax=Brassica cretica TaxID=69181 RepID=A0A8S9RSH0_BRACR|nr:hypothetical protein F2Q69_00060667 [Brassica cretica]
MTARGFWTSELVTLPMIVSLFATIRSSLLLAGIRTGGRFAGIGGAVHFSFSERLYLRAILMMLRSWSPLYSFLKGIECIRDVSWGVNASKPYKRELDPGERGHEMVGAPAQRTLADPPTSSGAEPGEVPIR